ncbi:MAG: coniferyl aldehyde dehydrogenase [Myxococcales bacterium]|nr:coniferyl aldehyde dehydrogenase [Myxococcales bacterium]
MSLSNVSQSAQVKVNGSSGKGGDLAATLDKLRAAYRRKGPPTLEERLEHLAKLEEVVLAKKDDIVKAARADFGNRARQETLGAEVMVTVQEIKHARSRLPEWMEPEPREVGWMFMPARVELTTQPLGVVGIISPWNYPTQLALGPLVGVLAAGNRAMIKPSELAPESSDVLQAIVSKAFEPDHVTCHVGGADVAAAFSALPFDHLVFTGSTRVGKIIMRAAAENLVPVTLELGGKSPAIVGPSYSLKTAAQKIMHGKLFNGGQTCIAPDYVMVPKGKVDAFVEECRAAVAAMYPKIQGNPDYTTIISDAHFERIKGYVADARTKGANVVELTKEELMAETRTMAPTLILHPKEDMTVMQEEIFGPVLPIRTYETLDDAIAYINDHPRPLALYYFEDDQARIDKVLRETTSGGVCVNDTLLHFAQTDAPFGGVGASGMGHYHGREGFEAFSKKKTVFYQSRFSGTFLFRPPFKERVDTLLRFVLGK